MRKLLVATIASIICHAAALVWVARDGDAHARAQRVDAEPQATDRQAAIDPTAMDPSATDPTTIVEVVLLEPRGDPLPDLARVPAGGAIAAPTSQATRTRGGESSTSDREQSGDATGDRRPAGDGARAGDPPTRSRWMTMRGAERPRLALPEELVEGFLENTKPLQPPPNIPGERLRSEIAELRRRVRAGAPGALAELVARNAELAAEELKPSGRGTYRAEKRTFAAKVDGDGGVKLEDKPEQLDTQDMMMKRRGIDPYGAEKLALLDRTREQRVAVGERTRRARLEHSAELMQNNIDRLWAMTADLAARKAGLFELWDDCAETGSDAIVAGGAAARMFVLGVIRARLHGRDAYTAEELARLNAARRSTAVFAPYD